MIVTVRPDGDVQLEEPADTARLEIHAPVGGAVSAAQAGAGLGGERVGALHHWLDIARLRALAEEQVAEDDWAPRWDDMIAFAARHGWTSADGASVMAHTVVGAP
ncbi:hypothetical protein [Microbacterium hominis]|uniref:hypothetical protein n=1 Tax=Microbacterium hominis TaxID=162426 RepID=UPI000A556A85|nr:hypothetical protein [Microbacterium hominis]